MSEFKIGIIADSLRLPFTKSIEKCASLGADGVQLYAVAGDMAPENLSEADIAERRRIIKENGLIVSALCGDLGGHGFTVREQNPAKIDRSKHIIDLALKLGTNIVTTHIGIIPDITGGVSDRYRVMQEACNELAEYAHSNDAFFAIETGPEPAHHLATFLDSLDSKGVAVNLDPANLVMVSGDDPVEAVYTLKEYIVHTHAKDGRMMGKCDPEAVYHYFADGTGNLQLDEYFKEVPLGQGGVDFDGYLNALREIGYAGFLTIEREVGDDPAADIEMAVHFLRERC